MILCESVGTDGVWAEKASRDPASARVLSTVFKLTENVHLTGPKSKGNSEWQPVRSYPA